VGRKSSFLKILFLFALKVHTLKSPVLPAFSPPPPKKGKKGVRGRRAALG
jgi:hypothetical protein